MTTWLAECVTFPFPTPAGGGYSSTTDISQLEVAQLKSNWKAQYAVRDDTLVQKLCHTLDNILGDTILPCDPEELLLIFGHHLQFRYGSQELEDLEWSTNTNEAKVVRVS